MIDKEIMDALCFLHSLAKKNKEFETQTESFKQVVNYIEDLETKINNKWIPCEERLPSETMLCLVTIENRMQKNPIIMWWIDGKEEQVSMFDDKKGHWKEQWCKVLAWQPLPQPYKKEGATDECR